MALSATSAYSIATPVARAAIVGGFDPNALLVARMLLSVTLLFFTMLLIKRRQLTANSACIQLALFAGLINGVGMILYFWGIARLEASMAAMIVSTSPLVVLSLLTLRGERLTYRHLVRLALALSGLYLLIGPGGSVDRVADETSGSRGLSHDEPCRAQRHPGRLCDLCGKRWWAQARRAVVRHSHGECLWHVAS